MAGPFAVVSCHVEQPLDDRCWRLFSELQERRPHGFPIAALMRPPDAQAGEDAPRWLERAREAALRGPLGHHTHFGGPTQARPVGGHDPAARVRAEAAWLREHGLEPRLFCGGGWYMDEELAETLVSLGYVDCTGTAFQPRYLSDDAPRLQIGRPAWLTLAGGRMLELPTTHSLGLAARAMLNPQPPRELVHVYFHDTDLRSRERRAALLATLAILARRRQPADVLEVAEALAATVDEIAFSEASRP